MDLSVNLAGLQLANPLMNAAGTCKLADGPEGVEGLLRTEAGAIVVGSGTVQDRPGNTGETYWWSPVYALNSLGLPNPGKEYYKKHLPTMVSMAHDAGKALIFSAAGIKIDDYAELTEMAIGAGVDAVEENVGCPNVWGEDGSQKRILSFCPELMDETLTLVERRVGTQVRLFIKISPLTDPHLFYQLAKVFGRHDSVDAVTAVNTFPNGLAFDEAGKSRITPGGGLAGVSGVALKPMGLGNVAQWSSLLPAHIVVIGVGGIGSGQDMLDYKRAGAVAFQTATAYLQRKGGMFAELLAEYYELSEKAAA